MQFTRYFLTAGKGEGPTALNAVDMAYLDARVGNRNLIVVSSILPPGCEQVEPFSLQPDGSLQYIACALQSITAKQRGNSMCYMSAAVAVGIPEYSKDPGLIMEHHGFFNNEAACEDQVEDMVKWGMQQRGIKTKELRSISSSIYFDQDYKAKVAAVFAAVVLLP